MALRNARLAGADPAGAPPPGARPAPVSAGLTSAAPDVLGAPVPGQAAGPSVPTGSLVPTGTSGPRPWPPGVPSAAPCARAPSCAAPLRLPTVTERDDLFLSFGHAIRYHPPPQR